MQMGEVGAKLGIDLVVSTGDNFYKDGLKGVNDPAFAQSFSKIYSARSLHKPWYASKFSISITLNCYNLDPELLTQIH